MGTGAGNPMEGSMGRAPRGTAGLIGMRMGPGTNGGRTIGTPRCREGDMVTVHVQVCALDVACRMSTLTLCMFMYVLVCVCV